MRINILWEKINFLSWEQRTPFSLRHPTSGISLADFSTLPPPPNHLVIRSLNYPGSFCILELGPPPCGHLRNYLSLDTQGHCFLAQG